MGFLRCGKRVSYKTGLCRYDSFGPKRVGFGCFPTRFAQVAAAFAVSWACGRCACVRGAWEEGRGGDGVGAMGSCQGVFGCGGWDWRRRAPRRAPALGSRFRENDGGGERWDARGLVGACRRPAHLWIPAFAGTTMAGVGSTRAGDAPRRAPALGSRFRGNDGGRGVRDRAGGGRAPLDSCLCRNDARRRLPRVPAPALGSRFRGNDGGGVRDARGLLVAEGPSTGSGRTESRSAPAMWVGGGVPPPGASPWRLRPPVGPLREPQDRLRFRANGPAPAPLDSCLRRNDARRRRPRAAPLPWVPAAAWIRGNAGTTMAGVGSTRSGRRRPRARP